MTSSTGSRQLGVAAGGHQVGKAKMSWPDLACASAAMVSRILLPCEVMKSIWTSTFSLSAHSWTISSRRLVGAGHPMVPEADRQLAGRIGAAHERRGDKRRRGGRGLQKAPTRYLEFRHGFPSRWLFLPIVAARLPERAALLTGAVGVPAASCGRHVPSRFSGPASCTISEKAQSHGEPILSPWNKSAPGAFSRGCGAYPFPCLLLAGWEESHGSVGRCGCADACGRRLS